MAKTQLREDTAGTIAYVHTKPITSAKVSVTAPNNTTLVSETDATIDTASTTLSADADVGQRFVLVDSISGFVTGHKYQIVDGVNSQVVTVLASSGSRLRIGSELLHDFATGATVKGLQASYDLTATDTATEGVNYIAFWTVVDADGTVYRETIFDVVSSVDWYETTAADLITAYPMLANHLESYEVDPGELLSFVWTQRLKPSLAAKGIDIRLIKTRSQLVPLHCALTNLHIQEQRLRGDNIDIYQTLQKQTDMMLRNLLNTIDMYDADDDNEADSGEHKPLMGFTTLAR